MAKTNPLHLLLAVLVVAFILLVLTSAYDYVPYNKADMHFAKYEPMKESMDVQKAKTAEHFAEIVSVKTNKENFEPIDEVAKTVKYGPLRDSEIIDKFSQVTKNGIDGVDGCVSSGLTNSGGYICLTPDLIQLLKTRGGNASGEERK
jgi:hypothetical protein